MTKDELYESFLQWLRIKPSGQAHAFAFEAWQAAYNQALQAVITEWEKPYGLTDGTPFIDRLRRMARGE